MAWPRLVTWIAPPCALLMALAAGNGALAAGLGVSWLLTAVLMGLPGLLLGPLIARSRPNDAVAALLAAAGFTMVLVGCSDTVIATAALHPESATMLARAASSLSQGIWMFLYLPWALVLLCFPAGRIEGRDRTTAGLLLGCAFAFAVAAPFAGPYDLPIAEALRILPTIPWAPVVGLPLIGLFMAGLVACAVSMVRRYRRGDNRTRGQIRWLATAAAMVPGTLLLCWIGELWGGGETILLAGLASMYAVVPSAVAITLLRADTVVNGVLAVRLAGILLAGAVVALAIVLVGRLWTGDGESAAAAAAGAAAVVVVLVLRPQLEHLLGLLLDPGHERVLAAVAGLQERISAGAGDPEELQAVLSLAHGDPALKVILAPMPHDKNRPPPDLGDENMEATPVMLGEQVIGRILTTRGSPHPRREAMAAAAPIVELARHRRALSAALAEAQAGRARIVQAAHLERRRLERDLHDGVQQQLLALGLALRRAQRQLPEGAAATSAILDDGVDGVAAAVAELRRIARGLQPGSLDDGLTAALRQLAGRPGAAVGLEMAGPLDTAPEIMRATVYFVASEALANAAKHAQAASVRIKAERIPTGLTLHVSDDGPGGAVAASGGGLAGLADRVAALGGIFRLASPPGGGTVVEAWLPCD